MGEKFKDDSCIKKMKLNNLSFLNLFTGIYDNFEERIYDNFEERFGAATNYKSVALPIELWGLGKLI